MPEVEKSIDKMTFKGPFQPKLFYDSTKNKTIKIQDGETLFDVATLLWSEMQQGKPFLWHFSQHREAILYSLTITAKKILLPLK